MTEFLAEQMRSIARRLMEIDSTVPQKEEAPKTDTMSDAPLSGSINTRLLADLLNIHDVPLFNQTINKVRTGKADHLNRKELTELAIAFVNLLDAKQDDTQKAMNILKKVTKPDEELMEDSGPTADHYKSGENAGKSGKSEKDNPHKSNSPEGKEWLKGWKAGCKKG